MTELTAGKRLHALIEQHGYTLTDLAPLIGYRRETLSKKLNHNNVDKSLVEKVSNVLCVDLMPVVFPPKGSNERDVRCDEEKSRLRAELEAARQTISDLSAALRALTEKTA